MATEDSKDEIIRYVEQHIPALKSLGAVILAATEQEVIISAPLAKNYNDKASAFAGSQYVLAIAACWALAYLNARAQGIATPDLIGAEGHIKYLKPARSAQIMAHAKADPEGMKQFRSAISRNRIAVLHQQATIEDDGTASECQFKFMLPKSG